MPMNNGRSATGFCVSYALLGLLLASPAHMASSSAPLLLCREHRLLGSSPHLFRTAPPRAPPPPWLLASPLSHGLLLASPRLFGAACSLSAVFLVWNKPGLGPAQHSPCKGDRVIAWLRLRPGVPARYDPVQFHAEPGYVSEGTSLAATPSDQV
jgi:hypothetical protein